MVWLIFIVQPLGCKGKGRDRGYKVTNMASHAASLVYTLATQCALLLQFHSQAKRSIRSLEKLRKPSKLRKPWSVRKHVELFSTVTAAPL